MGTRKLTIEIREDLHDRFVDYVINKFKAKHNPLHKEINTAVEIALTDFLDKVEGVKKGDVR